MSQHDLTRPRNVGIGAMAAPLLIIGALALLNGASEPRSSAADVQAPPDPELLIHASMGTLTEAQRAALSYREQIPPLAETDSPFPRTEELGSQFSDDPDLAVPGSDLVVPDAPTFTVSVIMTSKAGHIALINGKAHREGDKLEGGWAIRSIDADAKEVVLEDGDGRTVTLGLKRPQAMQVPAP